MLEFPGFDGDLQEMKFWEFTCWGVEGGSFPDLVHSEQYKSVLPMRSTYREMLDIWESCPNQGSLTADDILRVLNPITDPFSEPVEVPTETRYFYELVRRRSDQGWAKTMGDTPAYAALRGLSRILDNERIGGFKDDGAAHGLDSYLRDFVTETGIGIDHPIARKVADLLPLSGYRSLKSTERQNVVEALLQAVEASKCLEEVRRHYPGAVELFERAQQDTGHTDTK